MKRFIIITLIKLLVYILIFLELYTIFNEEIIIPALLSILLIVLSDKFVHNFLHKYISLLLFPTINKIEHTLSEFNRNINGIIDYTQLLNEFYILFNNIFNQPQWAFYIFENNTFNLIRKNNIDELLPNEFKWEYKDELKIYYDLDSQDNQAIFKENFDISRLLSKQLNLLIPITGKNQVIALLFTNQKNKYIFRDPNISELALRIFQKGGNFLENTSLYLDVLQRNLEINKIIQVSEKLLSSFNTNEILDFILTSLQEVIPYDAGVIFLMDTENGELLQKANFGYGEQSNDLSLKIGQGACGWVAENRQISIIDDVKYAENYYPLREQTNSQVALPLIIHDEVLGVICLEKNEIAYFNSNVIEILNIFASLAAIALYNAKQYEVSMAKKSLESELINAGNVQQVLLPKRAPCYKNLDISFINIPSKIVSGDLYDLIPMDDNHLGVIIGDISGKGAGAAIMMSLLLAGFRAYKKTHFTVCETVARLNNLLEESVSASRYATFFYGIISIDDKKITYTNAGHNAPIILRKDGTIEKLQTGGIVLGYLSNETYHQEDVAFNKGDLLVLYTDGITEAMNDNSEEFGENRLLSTIKKNNALNSYDIKNNILDELKSFTGYNEPDDDATLVIIKYTD